MTVTLPATTTQYLFSWVSGITGQLSIIIFLIGGLLLALYIIPKILGKKPEDIEYVPYDDDIEDWD